MRKYLLMVFVLVAGLAAPPAPADTPGCRSQAGILDLPYPSSVPDGWDHDRFGTEPLGDASLITGAFLSSFDGPAADAAPTRALPRWVAYEMRALVDDEGNPIRPHGARRPSRWYELGQTTYLWRDRPGITHPGLDPAYRGAATTWNRGHLAARAHANRIAWQEGCNTHVFVNALPQHARLNQGDWLALENHAVAAANRFGRVWTIAGPVFEPGRPIDTIGDPGEVPVAVPHAVFKILAIETATGIDARAFLFPQAEPDQRAAYRACAATPQEAYDLGRYGVTLSRLEDLTGLRFFTRLPDDQRHALAAAAAAGPWPIERRHYAEICGRRAAANP